MFASSCISPLRTFVGYLCSHSNCIPPPALTCELKLVSFRLLYLPALGTKLTRLEDKQTTTRGLEESLPSGLYGQDSHGIMSLDIAALIGGSSENVNPSTPCDVTAAAPGCEACFSAPETTICFADPLSDLSDSSGEDDDVREVRALGLGYGKGC